MILCIDIGNTNAVLGLYDNDKLLKTFRCDRITKSNFINFIENGESIFDIKKVIISSVNINVNVEVKTIIKEVLDIEPIFVEWSEKFGLKSKLLIPSELGADLLIGGYAATLKYGVPNIVIDMGTATTMFAINSKKEILGGAITAGAVISYKELMNKASKLKNATFMKPAHIIGNDTNSAIGSGIFYGNAIMIDGFVKKMCEEMNEENVKVIITGGMANVIIDYLEGDYIHDDNLLLDGLYEASKIL